MAGFTSRDDIINEVTVNGKSEKWTFYKVAPANAEAAGVWQSLWKGVGNPGAGSDPAATPGTAYTSTPSSMVAGSICFADRSPDQKHGLVFKARATQNCTLKLYDRLVGVSGIALNSTGSKTINSSALPRYSGTAAVDNEAWLEVTTATTTTAPVVNLNSYTSSDGTTGLAGGNVTFPAAATDLHTMIQLPLNASEQGIRSAEAGLNVGTAAAAGACNFLIIREIATIGLLANVENSVSLLDDELSLPRVFDGANLGLMIMASTTTATTVWGSIQLAYG